jgi:hypothetical protein
LQPSHLIRFLTINNNGDKFVNEENTTFILPELPYSGMRMEFLMLNDNVELRISGNGKTKIFSNKGLTDEYVLSGTPKNRAAVINIIGCGDYWRIQPNFF